MIFHKLIRAPHIVQKCVYSRTINSFYNIKKYSSSADHPDGYIYVKPKRLLKIPYALTLPPFANNQEVISNLKEMDDLFPEVIGNLKNEPPYQEIPEMIDHLKRAIEYIVPYGKRVRSIRIMQDYNKLVKPADQTAENWKLMKILCWIQEIVHAAVLLNDDIMDNSDFRRGRLTWFKQPGVGMRAITDMILMHEFGFFLLTKYWRNHSSYVLLMELFHKYAFYTYMGQGYDSTFRDDITGRIKFEDFTMQKFRNCAKYKTTSNALAPPFELSLAAAKKHSPNIFNDIAPILIEIGNFFQMLNDFKDLFHDQGEVVTKSEQPTLGADIPTGQLTWFSAKVLESGTEEQKLILIENYGRTDPKCVEIVYRIYEDMKLDEVLFEYEETSFRWLESEIRKINNGVPHAILQDYVENLYKRRPNI